MKLQRITLLAALAVTLALGAGLAAADDQGGTATPSYGSNPPSVYVDGRGDVPVTELGSAGATDGPQAKPTSPSFRSSPPSVSVDGRGDVPVTELGSG
jgi:hypothetical protein